MPPHCDTMDGPVVKAARRALDKNNVDLILPFVKKDEEQEVIKAFTKASEREEPGAPPRK